ncbi:FG-GAP-like repeat-containing protein [Microcoleus sp. FACHB-68]|uniref:FG-GAP-like repeat-containing protein n=1 Tax=Microcoleus sp. FACHB-68 TaxID=2692826 RepID=UPI001685A5CC|nr:FG-GAP-like repeat-containing protein [Microcoleus sp. FACHB-68]MBD1939003.1 VCBS repeat-containing protein [Microcoleus sp. FACHB-68]
MANFTEQTGSNNPFNGVNVGYFATPTFADIDSDGDLDAFVGSEDGNTYYFQNTGTASALAFADPVTNAFNLTDVRYLASPTFADIDSDGDLDAFVGEYLGNTLYYQNTGTASAPAFADPVTNAFNLTDVGRFPDPTFADIDSDGDLDAFVGSDDGNTYYYQNTGTASAPALAAPQINPFNLTNVGFSASPTFADIDGDSDLDAFIGNNEGNTYYYQNTGTTNAPAFAAPQINAFNLTDVGDYASPTFADIDDDGDLDAFIGNNEGIIRYYQNSTPVVPIVPIVSIAAGTSAAEGGATGTFILSLNEAAPDGGITVAYTVGGSATNGSDYTALTGTATFASGATTATINVVATNDAIIDPNESVTITLSDGASYDVATTPADTATVTIADNDIAYAIVANTATVAEGNTGTRAITYTITRTGRTDVASSVNIGFGGSATNNSDYTLAQVAGTGITNTGNTVNFASGATSATVTLNVVGDTVVESNETIQVSLTPNTTPGGFQATVPNTTPATTTITNDDAAGLLRTGTAGNDTLYGQGGNDTLQGLAGNDNLQSGGGKDLVLGGTGRDSLMGGAGDDSLDGGDDNDTLLGGDSNDSLLGGNNNDSLLGGAGNDWLDGGANNDTLTGGTGSDTLTGGTGQDFFVFASGNRADTLLDFTTTGSNQDTIGLAGGLRFEQLTITSAANPANTIIKITDSDEILATLIAVQANSLNSSHFLSI